MFIGPGHSGKKSECMGFPNSNGPQEERQLPVMCRLCQTEQNIESAKTRLAQYQRLSIASLWSLVF